MVLLNSTVQDLQWHLKRNGRIWQLGAHQVIRDHCLLQLRDMKSWVNTTIFRQLKFISYFPNLLNDGKGPKNLNDNLFDDLVAKDVWTYG
jgi:hypothetical protein